MYRKVTAAIFSLFAVSIVMSAEAETRATKAEIIAAFVGKTAKSDTGAELSYGKDGTYTYRDSRRVVPGKYEILEGRICISFANNKSRCDLILKDGNGFVLMNSRGQKYRLTLSPN